VTKTGFASERWPGDPGISSIGRFDLPAGQKTSGSVLKSFGPCNPSYKRPRKFKAYLTTAYEVVEQAA
jgi:hypothetical protein